MDTNLLLKTFPSNDNPGLSLVDPRFSEIGSFIQSGDYSKASALAESIISDEIFDIRIICYFLFGVLLENGTNSFPQIMESILGICTDNWDATLPLKNKEKQVTNSLKWLFKQVSKKIEYEEKKESPEWLGWQNDTNSETIEKSLNLCNELQQTITEKLGTADSQLFDGISKIKSWLSTFYKLVHKEPEAEEPAEETSDPESEIPHGNDVPKKNSAQTVREPIDALPENPKNFYLTQLLKKITAFEILISKEKFEQASLVAFDINHIINNFDPKLYFPELFGRFSLLFALNVKEIISCNQYTKTAEWESLQELYKVDIEGFTQLDMNISFSETMTNNSDEFDHDQDPDYDD